MAYKRGHLTLFYPVPAKLSCYLEAEGDIVEGEEQIILDDIDDPSSVGLVVGWTSNVKGLV